MIPNKEIIDNHKQLSHYSCIPMAAVLVLKLLERAPSDYFELQTQWNNFKAGTFANFDGKTIKGVTFHHKFSVANGRNFPPEKMKQLFDTIDHELEEDRYVVVSLTASVATIIFARFRNSRCAWPRASTFIPPWIVTTL